MSLRRQHVENMRVAQAKVAEGSTDWYVVTANGGIVSGPFSERLQAEADLALRIDALDAEEEVA